MKQRSLTHTSCSHVRLRGTVCLDCSSWHILSCPRCEAVILNLGDTRRPPLACSACGTAYPWTEGLRL